jgi:radical SAM protein with 4Fe4S-binding SPASM domain
MPKIDLNDNNFVRRRVLMLTITRDCNLNCKYCYESKAKRKKDIMSFEVAREIITKYMNLDDGFNKVEIQFFGGEPMLAFHRIKEIVEWFHSKEWEKDSIFNICTNGTILNDGMKKWLKKNRNRIFVGFSLDGNRISHNITRSNSYHRIKKNIPFFLENWPAQYAKMTICAENMPYIAESIIELEENEIPFTANVVFENIWGSSRQKNNLLEIYEKQLQKLMEYYSEHLELFPATIVDRQIQYLSDAETINKEKTFKRFCGAGHEMIEIDIDGSISPCHRFAKWITQKNPPSWFESNRQKKWKPGKCNKCMILPICPTCAGLNWEVNGSSNFRTTYHCEAFKLEVLASAKLQAIKIEKEGLPQLENISPKEEYNMRLKIDSILKLIRKGI